MVATTGAAIKYREQLCSDAALGMPCSLAYKKCVRHCVGVALSLPFALALVLRGLLLGEGFVLHVLLPDQGPVRTLAAPLVVDRELPRAELACPEFEENDIGSYEGSEGGLRSVQ